jgi:Flp pilus assembly protein TadD
MLFARVAAQSGGILRTPVTLGTAAMCLKWCRKTRDADQRRIQAIVQADSQIDYPVLLVVGRDLFRLNDYRKAAAHIELVSQTDYRDGRVLILGSGDQATPGLLARLVAALGLT